MVSSLLGQCAWTFTAEGHFVVSFHMVYLVRSLGHIYFTMIINPVINVYLSNCMTTLQSLHMGPRCERWEDCALTSSQCMEGL